MALMLMLGCAVAQTFQMRGVVCDKASREQLFIASIALAQDSSGFCMGELTNPDGTFEINAIPKGEYCMTVSLVGYKTLCTVVRIDGDLDLDTIWLTQSGLSTTVSSSDQWDDFDFSKLTESHLASVAKEKDYESLKDLYYQRYLFCRANPSFSHADSPADSALKYLTLCWNQDKRKNAHLYYPIRQVEHSLGVAHNQLITRPKHDLPFGYLQSSYSAMISDSCLIASNKNLLSPVGNFIQEDSFYYSALSPMGIAPFCPGDGDAIVVDYFHPFSDHELLAFKDDRLHVRNWDYRGTTYQSARALTPAQCDSIKALLKTIRQTPLADLVEQRFMCIDGPDNRVMTYIDGQQQWVATDGCSRDDDYRKELQILYDYLREINRSYQRKLTIKALNPNPESSKEVPVRLKLKHLGSDFFFQWSDSWSRLDHLPARSISIPAGKYRLIARAPGHFSQRTAFHVSDSHTTVDVKLRPMPFSPVFVAIHNWVDAIRQDLSYRRYMRRYGSEE